ncbi:unnamed protein product, partial [Ixodes hexagonus]
HLYIVQNCTHEINLRRGDVPFPEFNSIQFISPTPRKGGR